VEGRGGGRGERKGGREGREEGAKGGRAGGRARRRRLNVFKLRVRRLSCGRGRAKEIDRERKDSMETKEADMKVDSMAGYRRGPK
jgi:hypothetical protein